MICRDSVAKHNRTMHNGVGNCSSKIGSRHQSEKIFFLKYFLKGFLEGKLLAPKWRKFADKLLSQPLCSHSNTIYEIQLQKTIILPMQPQQKATLTQPFKLRERSYNYKVEWNFHWQLIYQQHLQFHLYWGNNPILQIIMEFCRPYIYEIQMKSYF